ncbi:MAG: flagellar basal body rod protein FlgC [Thermodesulfovibrionales bacterium]|nr:flagellar basal body rod protein FlgC [Thermodesulfovibrionales bacterium]
MDSFGALKISATALWAQRQRMNVIASNMANVYSTRTDQGGPYRRKDVIFTATPIEARIGQLEGVKVVEIIETDEPLKLVYDPSHPDAREDGYVELPNINIIEEMVNMMMSFRAYEASISTFNITKAMFMKTLELGR